MIIQKKIPLASYTIFKIGGPARYFCEAQNLDDIKEAVAFAKDSHMPFYILGAGSNILVSDDEFCGLVIKINLRGLKIDGNVLYAEAGVSMAQAVNVSVNNGLGGFEWAIGIPGTIGGSLFGNAGCFGSEIKDVVEKVSVLEADKASNIALRELKNGECDFRYRHSIFKEHPNWIIVSASLMLQPVDPSLSRDKVLEFSKGRVLQKKQTSGNTGSQEIGAQCAGCIFKNPKPDLAAGFLIDTAGLKGLAVGGAMISNKHANFIINTGNATAKDIKKLISIIKSKVKLFHGVDLEEEVRYL